MKKLLLFASMMALPLTANAQMLLNENFQSGSIPATWTVAQTNTVQTWSVSDLGASDFRATVDYDPLPGAQNEMLITPSMDFTTATSFTLKANIGLSTTGQLIQKIIMMPLLKSLQTMEQPGLNSGQKMI